MSNASTSLIGELISIVGEQWVLEDTARLLVYSSDGLPSYKKIPGIAVFPGTRDQTIAVVRALAKENVPFVPRGAGTGLSGGALADGTVLLGLHRLKNMSIDIEKRRATVEPGVVNLTLNKKLAPHGLMYAPDPSSESACTIGGNVAENAGGPHCLKYGVTLNHIAAVTALLPNGEIVELGSAHHVPETYDLLGAFIGSEGCFGIALDITVKLTEKAPTVTTLLADFTSVDSAARTTSAIIASGIVPAALEFMDGPTIRIVESSIYAAGYPKDAEAILLIELDGNSAQVEADTQRVKQICSEARNVQVARSDAERAKLWQGRKKAFGAMGRIAPHLMVQDAVIPRSKLPEILAGIHSIGAKHGVTVYNVFHAGDGNLHPNIAYDADNIEQSERVHAAMSEIMQLCVNAGGSITGEHGVGLDKLGYMDIMFSGDTLTAMCDLRTVFDPDKRSNPGKVIPVRSCREWHSTRSHSLGDIKPPTVITHKIRAQTLRVRDAILTSSTVRIEGAATWKEALGWIESDQPLSLRDDTGIVEYSPEDFTVTARAGTSLKDLSDVLAEHNQYVPLSWPKHDPGTLGAIIATATGNPRDHVLGLEFVTGRGDVIRSGGKVVKNVAGFDLTRLLIGSWGTLGVITEITIRTRAADSSLLERGIEGVDREHGPRALASEPRGAGLRSLGHEGANANALSPSALRDVLSVDPLNPPQRQRPRFGHEIHERVRRTFDPRGVLNPGLILKK